MEAGAGELRQELADLREVVFNQQNGAEEEKAEEKVTEDLSALTLSELKDRAKDAGVKGYSAMKKQDLVEALTK